MIYGILAIHTILVVFCIGWERRRLQCKFIGPLGVGLLFSYLPNLVGRCGIVSYSTTLTTIPDLLLLGANIIFVISGLVSYSIFLPARTPPFICLDHGRSVIPVEKIDFDKIYWCLIFLFSLSALMTLKTVYEYGVGALLEDAAAYHNWAVEQGAANTIIDNAMQVIAGAGPLCLGFVLVIWSWKNVSNFQKVCGYMVVIFICFISVFMSRAILVMSTVPTLLAMIFSGALVLKESRKIYILIILVCAAFTFITIKRSNYLGSESAFVLLNYFGISSTILPDSVVASPAGQVLLTIITYISAPYSNFCNMINNHADLGMTYGIMSSRVINPIVSLVFPSIADLQRSSLYSNTDILLANSNGGNQWSMAYGATFLDFGFAGPFAYACFMGLIIPYCTCRAFNAFPVRAFLILYIIFFISFTSFQMPPLAPHHGVFLCAALFLLIVLFRDSSQVLFRRKIADIPAGIKRPL